MCSRCYYLPPFLNRPLLFVPTAADDFCASAHQSCGRKTHGNRPSWSLHRDAVIHASCVPCKASELGCCSHVVAVLLSIVDHVKIHGPKTTTPCAGKECTWIKGRKRKKNPQRLSSADYPTKRKQSNIQVIDFDTRPEKYQRVTSDNINKFVLGSLSIAQDQETISMRETQLRISYKDYKLESTSLLEEQVRDLISNISPKSLMQIERTEAQSKCGKWYCERWLRITASTCLQTYRVGQKVIKETSDAALSGKNYISSSIWNLVCQSGLWVNPIPPPCVLPWWTNRCRWKFWKFKSLKNFQWTQYWQCNKGQWNTSW